MWPFSKKENRQAETVPHKVIDTNACTEVNDGVALLNKLLNIKGYDAMSQSPFFAAVNLISNGIAQMSWETKSIGDDEVPYNFYTKHLFDYTNVTRFMTVKNLIKDTIIYGNGFAYIHRDKKGNPQSIEYLPNGECSIIYNQATRVLLYQVPRISTKLIEPINIIHVVLHSNDGIHGRSLLSFANNTVKLNAYADKSANEYFSNGMRVLGILSTDSPRLTKDQRESIRSAWNESQAGGGGSSIAVLEAGMKYSPISSSSKDAQLLETRLFNVQEVARWFNMSPVLLGDLSKTSYNSLEQSQLQFVLNTLSPYITLLEEELNRKIINASDKDKFYIDIREEDIVKSDSISYISSLTTLYEKGVIAVNEERKKLGYPPVEGGDELKALYSDVQQNTIGNKDEKQDNSLSKVNNNDNSLYKNNENKENEEQ